MLTGQPHHVAIIGGGIAGLAAAYEFTQQQSAGAKITFTLIEASPRLGGIVETVHDDSFAGGSFVVECGPDAWLTSKPWACELAQELGLADQLLSSNDADRITYILRNGALVPIPGGMRMMVPTDLSTLRDSPLFSATALSAYTAEPARAVELKKTAPEHDESVASFITRHFGEEVLRLLGAPLLGGVFGGDVYQLSVRAVMPAFVRMEAEYGSLILALQARARMDSVTPIFTTLRSGAGALTDALLACLPTHSIRTNTRATHLLRTQTGWRIGIGEALTGESLVADTLFLAAPIATARELLHPIDSAASALMQMPSSSAVIAAFGFSRAQAESIHWPPGFGFLAPAGEGSRLLAATFSDTKFAHRVPTGGRLVRAYFGGMEADALTPLSEEEIASTAKHELEKILGPLPAAPAITVVRRWPGALPQYAVGHVERMRELDERVAAIGNLTLLGNGYRGVGLPDLIRDARQAARNVAASIHS